MDLEQGDEMVAVAQAGDARDVMMVSAQGQAIKFAIEGITPRSRTAGGVRGIRLVGEDQVVSMGVVVPNSYLLIVSENGFGKSTPTSSYPRHSRGGQGVRTFRTTEKAGNVAAARVVADTPGQDIVIISNKAQVVRITLAQVRVTGRNTQGVIVWQAKEDDDFVASIACFQETIQEATQEAIQETGQETATEEAQEETPENTTEATQDMVQEATQGNFLDVMQDTPDGPPTNGHRPNNGTHNNGADGQ